MKNFTASFYTYGLFLLLLIASACSSGRYFQFSNQGNSLVSQVPPVAPVAATEPSALPTSADVPTATAAPVPTELLSATTFIAAAPTRAQLNKGSRLLSKHPEALRIQIDKLVAKHNKRATHHSATASINEEGKSQLVALLLAIFVGGLGIHRFYLGYTGIGIAQLLTLGGCGIWSLIDLIRIITGDLKPKGGDYAKKL